MLADRLKREGKVPIKEALKEATSDAVGRGVFGAPAFFVGDEMFWGNDRLHFVEMALKNGASKVPGSRF